MTALTSSYSQTIEEQMPRPVIAVRDLWRSFKDVVAVRGLSFDVYPGEVVGFIGANGAGKTTTMRIMATLDHATSGKVEICGFDVNEAPDEVRRKIGWMPDAYGAYTHMTVEEYLDFYGRAFGFRGDERRKRVLDVMEFTGLVPLADRMVNKLSKGMGQRVCLGRTLLHDPEVLILDEPAAGLDPKARLEFKNLVRLLAQQGKTIFISSHILTELSEMCSNLLFIDQGRMVHFGSAESLQRTRSGGAVFDVQVAGSVPLLREWVAVQPGIQLLEETKNGARIVLEQAEPEDIALVLQRMVKNGLAVVEFHREQRKLEDAFVDVLRGLGAAPTPSDAPAPPPLPLS